jgi:hypothetical protein
MARLDEQGWTLEDESMTVYVIVEENYRNP